MLRRSYGPGFAGFVRRRLALIGTVLLVTTGFFLWHLDGGYNQAGMPLLIGFLVGVTIQRYGDIIPWNFFLACFSAVAMFAFLYLPNGSYFVALPGGYLTVYLGLTNPRKIAILRGADFSYGLYLYGFAIQQAIARIFPWSHQWYINLALSLPLAAAFAALSWNLIEKPALRLRSVLPLLDVQLARHTKYLRWRADEA